MSTPPPITLSFDLEDHRPDPPTFPERYTERTGALLDWLDQRGITATVFVVGELADAHHDLMRDIVGRGHELALHNWTHTQLDQQTPEEFRAGVRRGKAVLEDITGQPVLGFRAPTASLVRQTVHATEILLEEGYTYSSSVIPARNPLYGFEGVPSEPFRWPCGLAEFPVHVGGIGRYKVPYTAGTYLRVLPWPVIRLLMRTQPWAEGNGTYFHPYDLDPGEPFHWLPEAGALSPLLWVNRRRMLVRLERLFRDGAAPPYRELLHLPDRVGRIDLEALAAR